ncbi:hypothetical protein DB88DRAFT_489160 [Papiliotrema laurentii]|uniref:Uncharacterized protein n=1 Tax=Papiliotrema laurentii TaxID=5418 RepID=A0AAD9CXW6_PAPLA|nr:hypothetical protein DB88DRAFT_489160 [Papiliotrema laurentii]
MMPDDLSLLDRLEEWLEAQVPRNLNDLPHRMLETMERMSNEIFDTLNIQGAPSISIPFPPFAGEEPPPPPPPPTITALPCTLYHRAGKLVKAHPYVLGTGAALALSVGIGYGTAYMGYGGRWGERVRNKRKFGTRGVVQDGMLKEAIVILSPSPMPPLLWVLTVTLLKAGYVVLVAVPRVEDAEALEKRMGPVDEKTGLRVLIYDPDDINTFPPFQRSLEATLTLRFPAANGQQTNDPYQPHPDHIPHIHAFVSLYPLHPDPPNQPSALPALPTLLSPQHNRGRVPLLINVYPSGSVLVNPDSFSSQVLTANHRLLGQNLAASHDARVVSLYIGHLNLPPLHQMISNARPLIYRFTLKDKWNNASTLGKLFVVKDAIVLGFSNTWANITGRLGVGAAARDYRFFEKKFLSILKSSRRSHYSVGQYPYLPFFLSRFSPALTGLLTPILPTLPGPTGPLYASVQGLPAPRKPLTSSASTTTTSTSRNRRSAAPSSTSSDHDSGEDMASSMHSINSARTTSSREAESSLGSGTGMEDSWAHLDVPPAADRPY